MQHVGSSSLTRDQTLDPLHWEHRVLATRPLGKSLYYFLLPWVFAAVCGVSIVVVLGLLIETTSLVEHRP